jgi:hypothetical protein
MPDWKELRARMDEMKRKKEEIAARQARRDGKEKSWTEMVMKWIFMKATIFMHHQMMLILLRKRRHCLKMLWMSFRTRQTKGILERKPSEIDKSFLLVSSLWRVVVKKTKRRKRMI